MAAFLKFSRQIGSLALRQIAVKSSNNAFSYQNQRTFSIAGQLLAERRFSEAHEWVTVDGNIGTVGISSYAQDKLGDIAYVQLPEEGAEFDKDEECGALESVKAASEIFSPVSGKVTEINTELAAKPALINQSCYEKGWLFKIELSKPDEVSSLMDEAAYETLIKNEDE